ncbi:RICIN domain-containing protein [Collinsella sp. LCP21S3_A3]|uniref:RICIN domain-containing protein n=1 Tax=Collinsella sp. LCP21S3_A3 TaxID=3438769 RepID=UPI003F8F07E6
MAIAHSDHTANYQKGDYAYRSTDLSNNYFVRNGKADEWAEKYADRIQQHLNAKEESFSIDADNQSFPPSISGIQYGIIAYAINQREWKAQGANVELDATSNVTNESNIKWSAKYDLIAKYATTAPKKLVEDGEYLLAPSLGPSLAVSASGSGCSLSASASPIRFAFDGATGCYRLTSGGMALTASGSAAVLAEPDGSASQLWRVEACEGGWSVASLASGLALDVYCRSTVEGNLVWLYEPNGTAAQAWELSAPK